MKVLICSTDDIRVGDGDGEHSIHEVREGRESVHENPEMREDLWGSEDTTEEKSESEHQIGNVSSCFGSVDGGDDHGSECGGEEQELPDKEEHQAPTFGDGVGWLGVTVEADRVVPAEENEDSHQ